MFESRGICSGGSTADRKITVQRQTADLDGDGLLSWRQDVGKFGSCSLSFDARFENRCELERYRGLYCSQQEGFAAQIVELGHLTGQPRSYE